VFDALKDNPVKTLLSVASAITVIIGTAFTIDGRYVRAADFADARAVQNAQLKQMQFENRLMIDDLRKKQLEDKLFELEFKDHKTQLDAALIERYKRELTSIDIRNKSNTRLQNSLPDGE
jgi:hypothetical protein